MINHSENYVHAFSMVSTLMGTSVDGCRFTSGIYTQLSTNYCMVDGICEACGKVISMAALTLAIKGKVKKCTCIKPYSNDKIKSERSYWYKLRDHHRKGKIKLCQRWAESFHAFYDDVGSKPKELRTHPSYPRDGKTIIDKHNFSWVEKGDYKVTHVPIFKAERTMMEETPITGPEAIEEKHAVRAIKLMQQYWGTRHG